MIPAAASRRARSPAEASAVASSIDVARRAGVSQSAVSRVFTPGASVSARMREKVLLAAGELDYRPNVVARSLTTGRSRMIGLVVAYLDNQYYPLVVERISKALQARGYHVLMLMTEQTATNIDDVVGEILDYQVDGIIVASVALSSQLADRCVAAGVPVALFNRVQNEDRFSAVTSDNVWGGWLLARFLVAGGHRRIAYLAGWEGASTQRDRERGFRAGLAAARRGLFARDCGNYTFGDAQAAARRMFAGSRSRETIPDAIFVCNDHMAIAAMDVLRHDLGLRVPEDVSVVSYDDVPQAAWPSYGLTTMRQPTEEMITATLDALILRIEDGDLAPHRSCLRGPLMVRTSARVPRNWPRLLATLSKGPLS
jgi:DNA-binding LacI/PurR family transcriptional regulator